MRIRTYDTIWNANDSFPDAYVTFSNAVDVSFAMVSGLSPHTLPPRLSCKLSCARILALCSKLEKLASTVPFDARNPDVNQVLGSDAFRPVYGATEDREDGMHAKYTKV